MEKDLHAQPFLQHDMTKTITNNGHSGVLFHRQPELERALRDAGSSMKASQLCSSCTLVGIEENEKSVIATYTDSKLKKRLLRGSFLVGADGKTGFVRKRYLEPKGVIMERSGGEYDETWVAMNWHIRPPTRETHPDFPLWKLNYTPEDVYNAFFPRHFTFHCHPERPIVGGRFGLVEDRMWRFEYPVESTEDATQMSTQEEVEKVIYPYITHSGQKYGLDPALKIVFPKDCIDVARCRPFNFSARSCNKWAAGRVMVAGDAAHVFP
jgi:2-polyprenyl-6-methoxyphenol hydroxylase-like FAD-dependent oxidoreductase